MSEHLHLHACRAELGRSRIAIASGREQFRVAEAALAGWSACEARLRETNLRCARHQRDVLAQDRLRDAHGQQGNVLSRGTSCHRVESIRPPTAGRAAAATAARENASTAHASASIGAPLGESRAVATGACTARRGAAAASEPSEWSDEATAAVIGACCTVTREAAHRIIRPGGRTGQRGGKPATKWTGKVAAAVKWREAGGQRPGAAAPAPQACRVGDKQASSRGTCGKGGAAVMPRMVRGNGKCKNPARGGLLPGRSGGGGGAGGGAAAAAEALAGVGCEDGVVTDSDANAAGDARAEAEAAREAQRARRHSALPSCSIEVQPAAHVCAYPPHACVACECPIYHNHERSMCSVCMSPRMSCMHADFSMDACACLQTWRAWR